MKVQHSYDSFLQFGHSVHSKVSTAKTGCYWLTALIQNSPEKCAQIQFPSESKSTNGGNVNSTVNFTVRYRQHDCLQQMQDCRKVLFNSLIPVC